MWAGIWIEGNLADVADYLQAIAEAEKSGEDVDTAIMAAANA